MSEELKVKRSYAIPENEMVIIKDTNTLLHNIVDSELKEKDKEIERLNYIINELEKWLEEQHQFIIEIPAYTKEISIEHKTMEICYENVLDKLQELKGSDKE